MGVTLRSRAMGALASSILVLASMGASAVDAKNPAKWVDGTESMAPVPSPDKNEQLARKYNRAPAVETIDAAAVTTHVVWAMVAGDEEWQSFYGSAWGTQAEARMETADDWMANDFGIDFRRYGGGYYGWTSSPNTARPICGTNGLLSEFKTDRPISGTADVVLGFTNNSLSGGSHGCASGRHTIVKLHGSTTAQRQYNVWTTQQHEIGHLFGAPDRYPDPNGLHPNDVMEDHYNAPDWWCSKSGYNDRGIINGNAGKYD